jgi:hypothetical protein
VNGIARHQFHVPFHACPSGEFGSAMTLNRPRETHARKLVFLLVLLSHCALILFVSRPSKQKSPTQILHEPLIVFFLDAIKAKTDADAAKEPAASKRQTASKSRNVVLPNDSSQPTEPEESNAITDWYEQAHSVAEDAVERDKTKNAKRGFEHKMPADHEPQKASIFDPIPVPRAGTWDGPDRFYATDNCYYEYDRAPRPPPTALDNRLKTPVCKRPPKGGGDAMFKDLTPEYLKTLPEPKKP